MDYIAELAGELGIATWLLVIIIVWSLFWKLAGMWKAARKAHPVWFIVLFLVNTIGILEILYIYIFSEMKNIKDFREKNLKKSKLSKKNKNKKRKK